MARPRAEKEKSREEYIEVVNIYYSWFESNIKVASFTYWVSICAQVVHDSLSRLVLVCRRAFVKIGTFIAFTCAADSP